jgi:hypothetical protein
VISIRKFFLTLMCLDLSIGLRILMGNSILKGLFLFAIIVAKLVLLNQICFKLKPCKHKNDGSYPRNSYEGLCNIMMMVLTRLVEVDKSHKYAPSVWTRVTNMHIVLKMIGLGRLIQSIH